MDKKVCGPTLLPQGKGQTINLPDMPRRAINYQPKARSSWALSLLIAILVLATIPLRAQFIYDTLPRTVDSILFPYPLVFDNQMLAQTGVRYGLWATQSPYVADEHMMVFAAYEKIPAVLRHAPDEGILPIWNFRFWPDEQLYTWVSVKRNSNKSINTAYICNATFQLIDTIAIDDPHEFYVLPDGLGYAYLSSTFYNTANVMAPKLIWLSAQLDTVAQWSATDSIWGLNWTNYHQNTCNYTALDSSSGMVDYFHPNSIAAIKQDAYTLKIGIYNRNIDTEIELTYHYDVGGWQLIALRDNDKRNDISHQTDDSLWINTGHDLQYLYTNADTLVKTLWDNGGCRTLPHTGLKIFAQTHSDTLHLLRSNLYPLLARSSAMGNGGLLLPNRYATSIKEINTAIVYGTTGGTHSLFPPSTSHFYLGAWTSNNNLIFGVKNEQLFVTYRFYPYFDNQMHLDELRPRFNIQFSADSQFVTLSLDSSLYTDIVWLDGQDNIWSRTLTYTDFISKELIAYVTNDPSWFWFATHRYTSPIYTLGLADEAPKQELTIYPNPIRQGQQIQLSSTQTVTLTDVAGNTIVQCNQCNQINIPTYLPAGMYILLVHGKEGIRDRKKVIVY